MKISKRLRKGLEGCKPKLSLGILLFPTRGYYLDFFGYLITLPFLDRYAVLPRDSMLDRWGFYYFQNSVTWGWGPYHKSYYMPWSMNPVKGTHKVLNKNGQWVPYVGSWEREKETDDRLIEVYPYTYQLRSGKLQKVQASVYRERREYRQRWLTWCPLFSHKYEYIEVKFSEEIGEEAGSWKGGVVGTSLDVLKGESNEQALRRMERTIRFGR